ncbi:MAG: hypothetical protein PHQ72_07435 [Hespellia sp.]|nr:hypothetical protein [Hespellia sp.]
MDEKPVTLFDELITPPSLQILKLFIPYVPPEQQKTLAIYEKYLEFQSTIEFFQKKQNSIHIQSETSEELTFSTIFEKMKPYLSGHEKEMVDSISNAMNMMEMMKQFQEMENDADERMDEQSPAKEYGSEETEADQDCF